MKISKISKDELVSARNILICLDKGEYKLSGQMARAVSEAWSWWRAMVEAMEQEYKAQEAKEKEKKATPAAKSKPKARKGKKAKK